jgi:uncharacterized protein YneF (UPF0154 family)
MKTLVQIFKEALPVVIGVAGGMFVYELAKKQMTKTVA